MTFAGELSEEKTITSQLPEISHERSGVSLLLVCESQSELDLMASRPAVAT